MSTILVVAAHPDDETLGCGGTIARLAAEGHKIVVLPITDGVQSRFIGQDAGVESIMAAVYARFDAFHAAVAMLGMQWTPGIHRTGLPLELFPDQRLDARPVATIAYAIAEAITAHEPNTVYAHWAGDLNQDHQAVARATLIATRPQPGCSVREVYAYPVASATEWHFGQPTFTPNVFVDISATLETKIAALQCYASEMRPWPHPRSSEAIRADAHRWGSVAGLEAAEALLLLRSVR